MSGKRIPLSSQINSLHEAGSRKAAVQLLEGFLAGAGYQKVCDIFKKCMVLEAVGRTQLVSVLREQTRPNTKHATQKHSATSIRKAERSQTQLQRLRTARISTSSPAEPRWLIAHSPPPGGQLAPPSQAPYAGALTWSWPGSSPGCCGQTAGWLSSSLCPPCRPVIFLPLAPLCGRSAETPERFGDAAIGCCLRGLWGK